jgi:hypothetical protein
MGLFIRGNNTGRENVEHLPDTGKRKAKTVEDFKKVAFLRIPVMSTTDSDLAAQTGRHETGIGGRHPPERVDGMNRN